MCPKVCGPPKSRTTIYVGEDLWTRFKEICEREGDKMSSKIEAWIRDYVRIHEPGNPQKRLDVVLGLEKGSVPLCDMCGAAADRVYRLGGLSSFRCKDHRPRPGRRSRSFGWRKL